MLNSLLYRQEHSGWLRLYFLFPRHISFYTAMRRDGSVRLPNTVTRSPSKNNATVGKILVVMVCYRQHDATTFPSQASLQTSSSGFINEVAQLSRFADPPANTIPPRLTSLIFRFPLPPCYTLLSTVHELNHPFTEDWHHLESMAGIS
jgi:hypothetical protein